MTQKLLRIRVNEYDDTHIYGTAEGPTSSEALKVVVADSELPREWLYEGAIANLLLSERTADGQLQPQHIVLDPDYLIDVTAICRCATECGDAPATHLLQKFLPNNATSATQLGAVANQFLDDVTNTSDTPSEELYRQSLRKSFTSDPLRFTTVALDATFPEQCRKQFQNIQSTLAHHPIEQPQLETAFICPALGIQGRMDLMSGDRRTIIELKSGKGGFTGNPDQIAYKYEHALQMALYKESLYYNIGLPYAQVQTLLFYSLYPALMDIHLGRKDIHRAMLLRNGMVAQERQLRLSPSLFLTSLRTEDFNPLGRADRFFRQYKLPTIQHFLGTIQCSDSLSRTYFMTMLSFLQREQSLAKTGVEGLDLPLGKHGFADIWRTTSEARQDAGNLLSGLTLRREDTEKDQQGALIRFHFRMEQTTTTSNFRCGDLVMLHSDTRADFYFPCVIEELGASDLTLRLRFPQRDTTSIDVTHTYSIEPTHADSSFNILYQGLFSLLTTSPDRRSLLLGQRRPRTDTSRSLSVAIPNEELRDIVLRAKQAEDYFLLVGPPGTGKTNIALRQMVIEYLADYEKETPQASSSQRPALLLSAFTNRAVDEICQMLSHITPAPSFIRIGPELSASPASRAHTLAVLSRHNPTRKGLQQLLSQAPIIVGTIASISSSQELFQLKTFDTAIVDEASQVLEPQLLPLLCARARGQQAIRRFIFIGDHKQLPAVVMQSAESSAVADPALHAIGLTNCRNSLFERLHHLSSQQGTSQIIGMLHHQGRMHQDIATFASQQYYNGQLDLIPLPHQTGPLEWQHYSSDIPLHTMLANYRLLCFDVPTPTEAGLKHNSQEADLAALIVASLTALLQKNQLPLDWPHRLGIIVPFRSQIQQLFTSLEALGVPEISDITIDTVERYQGSQRDIILFTTVVSAPWQLPILCAPIETDGQLIDRKLNVAVTRARKQFILVGNLRLLSTCEPYEQLIHYIKNYQNNNSDSK
ncbi:MAG: ATP-binding protein [Bacteroidaceae bacterium]|nr:ATP-binding protein [Bacteroidaceae bacterium]